MIETSFEHKGHWWLPDNPDNAVAGSLLFDFESGVALELIGDFSKHFSPQEHELIEILHGVANGKEFTLINCTRTKHSMRWPGGANSSYNIKYAVEGYLFESLESVHFFQISVNFENLTEWTGMTGITTKTLFNDEGNRVAGEDFNFRYPDKLTFEFEEFILHFEIRFSSNQVLHAFNYEELAVITIDSEKEKNLEFLFENLCFQFQDFLTFCVGAACHPQLIFAKTRQVYLHDRSSDEIFYPDLRVFSSISRHFNLRKKAKDQYLLKLNSFNDNFKEVFSNWRNESISLEPVLNLHLSNIYNSKQYLSIKFLNTVQALESFHRRILGGKFVTDESYEPIREHFISLIPSFLTPDFQESLVTKFNYLHEFSLKQRLEDLINYISPHFTKYVDDTEKFVKKVKDTRNYLTHYDKSLKRKAADGLEMFYLNLKGRFLLELCILKRIGLYAQLNEVVAKYPQKHIMSK